MPDWKGYLKKHLQLDRIHKHRDARILDELADHLEERYREALTQGRSPTEAEAIAIAELGDPRVASDELAAALPFEPAEATERWVESREEGMRLRKGWMARAAADRLRDLRLAFRALRKRPLFTAVVTLVLALGIGGTTAIFTLADGIILSPLPFSESDRLVSITHAAPTRGVDDAGQCAAWHLTYEDEGLVFEDIGMYSGATVTVTGAGDPEAVPALYASSGVFRSLGLLPVSGRSFTPDDEVPGAPLSMMISHGYWQSRFGSSSEVIGQTLQVDGASWEIVGVMPPQLRGLEVQPALILPMRFDRSSIFVGNIGFDAVALLKTGISLEQANADVARMLPMAWDKFPGGAVASSSVPGQYTAIVEPLKDRLVGSVASLLWILFGGVTVVLLIACANVANLFLVRAEGRETEMAVRTALGASRLRIGWETMRESLLLGVLGGLGGLVLAYGGLGLVVGLSPDLPRLQSVTLSGTVLLLTLAISAGTGVLFGLIPWLRYRNSDFASAVNRAGRGARPKGVRRAQGTLVVVQIALALVLLVGSGLMFRTMRSLQDADPGFTSAEDILAFRLTIPRTEIRDIEDAASAFERIARRLEEVPGVTSVAMATRIPMDNSGNVNPFYVDGIQAPGEAGPPPSRRHNWIGESYFETMGIPLLAGRTYTWDDVHDRFPGAIISESLARQYWERPEDAIGARVAARPEPVRWHEVVGVAADVRYRGVAADPALMVYWPQVTLGFWEGSPEDQVQTWRGMGYAVRSDRVGTPGLLEDVRDAVWEISPNLPVRNLRTMPELMAQSVAQASFTLTLLGIASGVALILGLIGVYGVMSYAVSQRTRELGVRLALGAGAADVKTMVLREGLVLSVVGVGAGLALAWGLTRLMSGLLFGVGATDPGTYLVVALGLAVVAVTASYLPARRAAGIDPVEALRAE